MLINVPVILSIVPELYSAPHSPKSVVVDVLLIKSPAIVPMVPLLYKAPPYVFVYELLGLIADIELFIKSPVIEVIVFL